MIWIALEFACAAFLMVTGIVCWGWVIDRHRALQGAGRSWGLTIAHIAVALIACWHFLFGILKAIQATSWLML